MQPDSKLNHSIFFFDLSAKLPPNQTSPPKAAVEITSSLLAIDVAMPHQLAPEV